MAVLEHAGRAAVIFGSWAVFPAMQDSFVLHRYYPCAFAAHL